MSQPSAASKISNNIMCASRVLLLLLTGLMVAWISADSAIADEVGFEQAVQQLTTRKFRDKEKAVRQLADIKDKRTLPVLQALLDARLYYRKSDKRVVIVEPVDGQYKLTDPLNGEQLGTTGKRQLKKIGINNKLRKLLKAKLASLSLESPDVSVRLAAVEQMLGHLNETQAGYITRLAGLEQDDDVRAVMDSALALHQLDHGSDEQRLQAISALSGNLSQVVNNHLQALLEKDEQGAFIEPNATLRKAATNALDLISSRLQMNSIIETTFFGLSLGSVLLLAAIGLAITFGVMGVINMAHGELIMLGAYTTYLVQSAMPNYTDLSLIVAVPAAFIVSGIFGIMIERFVIRHLYGRPLETLLATFGVSLILQQLVRSGISAQNVAVSNPSWMSGSWQINAALSLTYNRLFIFIFAMVVFVALLLILKKTALGLQVRAVSQNRPMAQAMGIRSGWVDAMTFGLGSGVAGIAGVALSQLTNVGPNMGQAYIIDSFMVVVFGGVGNLWGTFVGALSLGVANKFIEPWSGAVLAKILVLVFIIMFIQKYPRGLFPQKGRSAEN